jgi:hypothetical protein
MNIAVIQKIMDISGITASKEITDFEDIVVSRTLWNYGPRTSG